MACCRHDNWSIFLSSTPPTVTGSWASPSGKWLSVTGDAVAGNATVVADVFS
jgi:hypothetical protein